MKRAPWRVVIAGDPSRPVRSFVVPRRAVSMGGTVAIASMLVGALFVVRVARSARSASDAPRVMAVYPATAVKPVEAVGVAVLPEQAESFAAPAPASPAPSAPSAPAAANPPAESPPVESFLVEALNTGTTVEVKLSGPGGEPDAASYLALRHELRCTRTGAESPLDPRLVEMLHQVAKRTGNKVQVVSAFRAPTNLHDHNFHTKGMAADIRVPGVSTVMLRELVKTLGAEGVGYYPTSQFIHIDMRDPEQHWYWTDTSGHVDESKPQHQHESAPPKDAPPPAQPSVAKAEDAPARAAPAGTTAPSTTEAPGNGVSSATLPLPAAAESP